MKRIQLFLLLLFVLILLALSDYLANKPSFEKPSPPTASSSDALTIAPKQLNWTKTILEKQADLDSLYTLSKTVRTLKLLERFSLKSLNVEAYKHEMVDPKRANPEFTLYELQANVGEGKPTFLNLQLGLTSQLSAQSAINATNEYGDASFYYNEAQDPNQANLFVRIKDTIYVFHYPKTSVSAFQFIQKFITAAKVTTL